MLAIGLTATAGGPAVADDDGSVLARAALPGKPVHGEYARMVPMAVAGGGATLVTVTTSGISKYAVTRHSIKRLGRNSATPDNGRRLDLEVLPDGRFGYVTDWPSYGPDPSRVQVFDLRRDRPRLVRTLTFAGLGRIHDTALTPDGQRLFLRAYGKLKELRLDHPARPHREPTVDEPDGYGPLEITADGTRMVTALTSSGRGTGDPVRVWDISTPGAPVLEREGTVRIPGEDTASWVQEIEISPQGDAIYVQSSVCTGECEDRYTETTRLRFSDLSTEAQTTEIGSRYEELAQVSNGGGKVFMRWVDVHRDQDLVWLDPLLDAAHRVRSVGNVRGMALSTAGKTRGTAYVAGYRAHKLQISAVRF